jgi:hypothetical protein
MIFNIILLICLAATCTAGAWSPVWEKTYDQNRFSIFSRDYFSRFSRDPNAKPIKNEIIIDQSWTIIKPAKIDPVVQQMVNDFEDQEAYIIHSQEYEIIHTRQF